MTGQKRLLKHFGVLKGGGVAEEVAMRRVSENVYAEIYLWGCNPGFLVSSEGVVMIDTPQQPIDAVRWRERLLEHGPIRTASGCSTTRITRPTRRRARSRMS
jgi:hypothetical protein